MVCSARFSWRSPERLRRCRLVSPDDAGIGAAPEKPTNAASDRKRPGWDQLIRIWAALIPDAGKIEQFGLHRCHEWLDVCFQLVGFLSQGEDALGGGS
jgi:hypothetical protein